MRRGADDTAEGPAAPADVPPPRRRGLVPFVDPGQSPAEFTLRAVLLGTLLSLAFGMVNAYLGLKIGLTVSASIPSAVLSMAVLRGLLRRGTILENNVVHTIASAGESLAAGVIFTVPALFFLGEDVGGLRIFLIGATAGYLGVLLMIPLRRHLTVDEHDALPFPEGTACAKVLIAGERGRTAARPVFLGIALGGAYQFLMRGLGLWRDTAFVSVAPLHKMSIGAELSPLFLGVGYLIGPRIAAVMLAGGLLAWAVLIPAFDWIGAAGWGGPLGITPDIAALDAWGIWKGYVRFVGAGAVACGGVVSIVRAAPLIVTSAADVFRGLFDRQPGPALRRTELDLPAWVVSGGTLVLCLTLWLAPGLGLSFAQVLLAVGFTYFFVVVSARMVGLIGTTSQPVSGMTITALLVSTFVLHLLGYRGTDGVAAGLSVAVIVCTAIALAGDVSQDLKCGALLGATPRSLQLGEMIGITAAALRAGWVLYLLHEAYGLGSAILPAPQARLMHTLAQGVMEGHLPWGLLGLGAALAALAESAGISSLPFAIGLYLPVTTTAPLIVGGLLARRGTSTPDSDQPATLFASGLIAGDALVGILIAALVVSGLDRSLALRHPAEGSAFEAVLTVAPFALLAIALARRQRAQPAHAASSNH